MNNPRKELGIDDWLELVKEDKNLGGAYISFGQYIYILEKENKSLKDKLKATRKGLNKVLSKRKKWKDRYYKEKRENKQLKEYCCKRNECSGRIKENHKLTGYEIINELEKWLEEQYSYYSHLPISLSTDRHLLYQEVLDKLKEIKGSDNQ